MLFNSFSFLLLFLPLTLLGYFTVGQRLGRAFGLSWLIGASLVFYASWEPGFLWLLIGSLLINYAAAAAIERWGAHGAKVLGLAVAGNVLLLLYYKAIVAGLFGPEDMPSAAFSTTRDVLIPLGLSFITFQQIAFLVDTHKGRVRRAGLLEYCAFITFFPQLVMGPIVHYRELVPQLRAQRLFQPTAENLALGIAIFTIGLVKKVVLADSIAPYVNEVYAALGRGHEVAPIDAWGAAIGFQFQLYFDFSGYADMAIGLGRMFNLNLPINFDAPLRAVDRFDMWRRWHVSFGAFMRQYLFFPLARAKRLRLGNQGALFVTTVISGIWHGLGVTFVVWGGLQGLIMLASHYGSELRQRLGFGFKQTGRRPWLAMMLTFFVTMALGVIFRSKELDVALEVFHGMGEAVLALLREPLALLDHGARLLTFRKSLLLLMMAGIVWGLPTTQRFFGTHWRAIDQRASPPRHTLPDLLPGASRLRFEPDRPWAIVIAALLFAVLLFMDDSSRFVYYQF